MDMAHLLALTLARALALVVGFGSFALYMAAFFFPEVHRKHDLAWSGVGLLYAVVLWFCAGQLEGALLLGQLSGVALLAGLGWQVLTLRRIKTPIQQQTLPGASSQELTQVAIGQAKAAADNFSLAETATAIAGVTSSAIAAARGQSPSPRSAAQACPIDTSAVQPSKPTVEQPAVNPVLNPVVNPVRSQPERQQTPSSARTTASPVVQSKSGQAARPSQPATYATDEDILQPIISPVEAPTAATPTADAELAADAEWGNWMDDEALVDSTAATVTVASVQSNTVAQSSTQSFQLTVDRSAFGSDRTDSVSTPVGQPAQSRNTGKLAALTGWFGTLLPFGKKKSQPQPMVTLPPRESSLPRSPQAAQSTPIQSSQPMLTIPRRESSLRRPSASTPTTSATAPSTAEPNGAESAISPDLPQSPIPDSDTSFDTDVNATADIPTAQNPESNPEEILIPETLPSDEEAWGQVAAIANPEDEALTEAVLIEADAQPSAVSLADTDLTVTPASPSGEVAEVPEAIDVDEAELAEATEAVALTQSDELEHEETDGTGQIADSQLSETNSDAPQTDQLAASAAIDEPEMLGATDHPALKRPNPPSPELLEELQRQHYTDAGQ